MSGVDFAVQIERRLHRETQLGPTIEQSIVQGWFGAPSVPEKDGAFRLTFGLPHGYDLVIVVHREFVSSILSR